ncbi:MAG: ABC transporter permease, partial [Deltaproteobacteria bacterium]|nr:ABC transporter permease [Deltaproteobacteria bacterium]
MDISIAWRNLWRNPRRTAIILTAVIVGITSMIVLSALSRGTMKGMVDNTINNLVGHIRIQDPGYRTDPSISSRIDHPRSLVAEIEPLLPPDSRIAERIKVDGMLSTSREHLGVIIVGIVPQDETGVSFIGGPVYRGRMISADESNGIIVGEALLDRISAKIGRKVVLMSQNHDLENVSKAFRIRGTYRTELAQTEKTYVFVPLAALQKMLGVDHGVTEISINLGRRDNSADPELKQLVSVLNGKIKESGFLAESWHQILPALNAYVQMFDGYMLIWFVVVFIAMGFGLVNTMLMAVYERMREFGLQRALGMRSSRIVTMVMVEILLLLTLGSLIANSIAFFLIKVLLRSGIDLSRFAQGTEMWGINRIIIPVLSAWDVYTANGV